MLVYIHTNLFSVNTMTYVPRAPVMVHCMNCGVSFEQKHASRKYCSNTCNVKASHARNGRPGQLRATRADLEAALAKMMALMNVTPELATATPPTAAKAQAKKPAAKAAVKPARENGKFVKSATKPAAPAAKAAATKPKSAKKAVSTSKKKITTPAPAADAAATRRTSINDEFIAGVLARRQAKLDQEHQDATR